MVNSSPPLVRHLPSADSALELFAPHRPFDNEAQLRRVYLRLAVRFHPDKWPEESRPEATRLFQAIGAAYQQLLNPRGLPPPSVRNEHTRAAVAAEGGNVEELWRLLREDPARANEDDSIGQTPLMFAARGGSLAAAELLLQHGAELEARNLGGWSALLFAALSNRAAMVFFLTARGAVARHADLVLTAYRGSAAGLEALLGAFEGDLADVRRSGKTLLHFTCYGMMNIPRDDPERYGKCFELLIRCGLCPNAIDEKTGRTCLHDYANDSEWEEYRNVASGPHLSFVEKICDCGASPTAKDNDGNSPISIAAEAGLDHLRDVLFACAKRQEQGRRPATSAL